MLNASVLHAFELGKVWLLLCEPYSRCENQQLEKQCYKAAYLRDNKGAQKS